MARFLTPEWAAAVTTAAGSSADVANAAKGIEVVVRHVVTGAPGGDVRYDVRAANGTVAATVDGEGPASVVLTTDATTAGALHRGETTAQEALMAGALRVEGDLHVLVRHAPLFTALAAALEPLRATTTYD